MGRWRVLGVSLGSSPRDFRMRWDWPGGTVEVCRVGTGGDVARAARLLEQHDGEVDAFGLGGVNLYLRVRDRRYRLPLGERLASIPRRTPVCDGTYIKTWWEPRALNIACEESRLDLTGRTVLFSSVLDRWPLAQALQERGARVLVGDAAFALRMPILFPGLEWFYPFAVTMVPVLRYLPLSFLYPLGPGREKSRPGLRAAFGRAQVLAGDFHFLRSRLPERLDGKWVITSGLGEAELALLRDRGVLLVMELGPVARAAARVDAALDARAAPATRAAACRAAPRALSANLAEAVVAAASGESPSSLGPEGIRTWCERLGFRPTVYLLPLPDNTTN
ncbi:MAG: quinate 5-dehydrogenase [Bacillota bacterium]